MNLMRPAVHDFRAPGVPPVLRVDPWVHSRDGGTGLGYDLGMLTRHGVVSRHQDEIFEPGGKFTKSVPDRAPP